MAILVVIISIVSIYGLSTKEPEHLYKGYSNYLKIAEENSEDPFVYIGSGVFNHIQSMPEFMIYDKSLILQDTQLEYLKDNEELENTSNNTTTEETKKKETAETNCLALTVRKNYNLSIVKNGIFTTLRMSWKVALSTFILNVLKLFF